MSEETPHKGSYSPEDNKLRLYPSFRFSDDMLARVKAHGFRWAPKQELFVCPRWTPAAEDFLLYLCGEIDDEDYSPEERAADRAERFEGYREKRVGEADGLADRFDSGPAAFGHQNRGRAERQAKRHDRLRVNSVNQWSKAEYWQSRTKGVISHALFKSSAPVRRGRLARLEKEQRKFLKTLEAYATRYRMWSKVLTLEGSNEAVVNLAEEGSIGINAGLTSPAANLAYALANSSGGYGSYLHPRTEKEASLYSLMTDSQDPITATEAAQLWLKDCPTPGSEATSSFRWSQHYEMRIQYERAMLANEGGIATDFDMEAGGWFGGRQIQKVNRSPLTKKVVSIEVLGPSREHRADPSELVIHSIKVERFGESAYQSPTDEEKAQFVTQRDQDKAEAKEARGKPIPLINPTDEDAQKLQGLWNQGSRRPSEVWWMTQAEYSARSNANGPCETVGITEKLKVSSNHYERGESFGRKVIFKARKGFSGFNINSAYRVIVLTDKPQKPFPWRDAELERQKQPTCESLTSRLGELHGIIHRAWSASVLLNEEEQRLLSDAIYVGWATSASQSQRAFTSEGAAAFREFHELNPDLFTKKEAVLV